MDRLSPRTRTKCLSISCQETQRALDQKHSCKNLTNNKSAQERKSEREREREREGERERRGGVGHLVVWSCLARTGLKSNNGPRRRVHLNAGFQWSGYHRTWKLLANYNLSSVSRNIGLFLHYEVFRDHQRNFWQPIQIFNLAYNSWKLLLSANSWVAYFPNRGSQGSQVFLTAMLLRLKELLVELTLRHD